MRSRTCSTAEGYALVTVLALVAVSVIGGLSMLRISTDAQVRAQRTTAKLAARAAADAGLAHAVFRMNQALAGGEWSFSQKISSNVSPLGQAEYSYTIDRIYHSPSYLVVATGRSGPVVATVRATVVPQSTFDNGLFADGYARPKHARHIWPRDLKKGGRLHVKRYEVLSYSSNPTVPSTGEVEIRTNSNNKKPVKLEEGTVVDGDVVVGPGARAERSVELRSSSRVTGDIYGAPELDPQTPAVVPQNLEKQDAKDFKPNGEPLSGNVTFKDFKLSGHETVKIQGDCTLYVQHDLELEKDTTVIIPEGSSLTLYVGHRLEIKGEHDHVGGLLNEGRDPTKLLIYGTQTCEKVRVEGTDSNFYGGIYAPYSKVELKHNGDIHGAVVGWDVKLHGDAGDGSSHFYFDERLRSVNSAHFAVGRWSEQ